MENRLIDIETGLAHHEQQISDMSDIIASQWKMIEELKIRMARLDDKIEQMEYDRDSEDSSLSSVEKARMEKPPHY